MKPKATFIIIALLVVGLFVYWGFEKQEELEREQYYYELTHFPKPTDTPTPTKSIDCTLEATIKPTITATPTPHNYHVSYNQSGQTFSEYNDEKGLVGSARIDDIYFEFEEFSSLDGFVRLTVYFVGEVKDYNEDFYIKYKLFDKNDYVVDDGVLHIYGLEKGDKFKNKHIFYDSKEYGNYKIELVDYYSKY